MKSAILQSPVSLPSFKQKFLKTTAVLALSAFAQLGNAQGTWTALTNLAPVSNGGGMLLLSDGTVLCKTFSGGSDGYGTIYNKLTPDANGSYANGTWSSIAPMFNSRLYYSSQVLKDGRVYVAGGEYGTGNALGETYNPLTNTWTAAGSIGATVSDANSEILEDGTVMQALVTGTLKRNKIYNPATNTYTAGPNCIGIHNESSWVKLPDNSILFVDRDTRNSERYIPSLNQWIADATVPVNIYDAFGSEQGGAVLLPNGKAIFFGSTGHNAIYTPSGNTSPGSWVAAPDFPNNTGTPDAPAAMMVDGKVLCAVSPIPTSGNHFPSPTTFYEYDYISNSFTAVAAPGGGTSVSTPVYTTNMIDLPNGQVLFGIQGFSQYYVYTPAGAALTAGKPTIKTGIRVGNAYRVTGTLFNGISEGATYGDDWQMNTNYPIIRLSANGKVYYARTYNWNSTGVMRGNKADTVFVTAPAGLPKGSYQAVVVANGISSNPVPFTYGAGSASGFTMAEETPIAIAKTNVLSIYPNPASVQTSIMFTLNENTHVSLMLADVSGRTIQSILESNLAKGEHSVKLNTGRLFAGIYQIKMITAEGIETQQLVVEK